MEFKLIEDETGKHVWTWGNVKKENRKAVLELIGEGTDQKTICESLDLSKGYVSKIRSKAVKDGHLSSKGELTQSGYALVMEAQN